MTEIEAQIDEFMDQAELIQGILLDGRDGDLVEELCYLATALACVPVEERQLCGLDEYHKAILEVALSTMGWEEVA